MKKYILGLLALNTVVSFSNVTGYLKFNGEVKTENEVTKDSTGNVQLGKAKVPLKGQLDLGFYLDENKDVTLFTGLKHKDKNQAYIGARVDTKIGNNSNLILNTIYADQDKDYLAVEEAFKNSLSAKNVWSYAKRKELEQDYKEQDKLDFYKENGYVFETEKEENVGTDKYTINSNDKLLLSAIVNGKADNFNYSLGSIYNLKNRETLKQDGTPLTSRPVLYNRVENFVKVGTQLGIFNVSGELDHTIGDVKDLVKVTDVETKLFDDSSIENNFKYGGRLKGNVKLGVESNGFSVSTKPLFDLYTVLEKTPSNSNAVSERAYKLGVENEFKYTGVKDLEVKLGLNYNAEVSNIPIKEGKSITDSKSKIIYKENIGLLLHAPSVVFDVKYENSNWTAFTKNKNATYLLKAQGKTSRKPNYFKPEEEVVVKDLYNEFETKNKLEYRFNNGFKVNGVLDDKFAIKFGEIKAKNNKYGMSKVKNQLVTGLGVNYASSNLNNALDVRYRLDVDPGNSLLPKVNQFVDVVFNNSYQQKLGEFDLTTRFDNFGEFGLYDKLVLRKDDKFAFENKAKQNSYVGSELAFKLGYTKEAWSTSAELLGRYYGSFVKPFEGDLTKEHKGEVELKTNVEYAINSNYSIGAGLDTDYLYNLSKTEFERNKEGMNRLVKDNFETSKEKTVVDYIAKKQRDIDKEKARFTTYGTKHILDVTPSVNAIIKYGKVTFKPEVSAKFGIALEGSNKGLRNVEGKGKLNVEYVW